MALSTFVFSAESGGVSKSRQPFSVRLDADDAETLEKIQSEAQIAPAELARGAVKAAVKFYRENGFITLPLQLVPQDTKESKEAKKRAVLAAALKLGKRERELKG